MATITSNTFLDGGTARTAGETWALNGGVLTIRTDTRWHANAPASMTGSLGSLTVSSTLGGGVLIDGTAVRWLPYNSGSGNVPAIGTSITQGGVASSYLLGVYSSMTAAPTAVGAAMPSSGFIKFREVDGSFSAGVLTGIGATATGPDVVGWIEVVMREATAITVPRLGFFRTRGDWFELGTTTGSAGQIVQVPTNGGGANTIVPAIWIETGVGTDEYEIYPAVPTTWFNTTNLSTDERCKFVHSIGSGQVRIGSDGSVNCGFTPGAGRKIRIPNVIGRTTSSANDAVNTTPNATLGTRPDFATAAAGVVDVENFINDWYFLMTAAYEVKISNSATLDIISLSNIATAPIISNTGVSPFNTTSSIPLTLSALSAGAVIDDSVFIRGTSISNGHVCTITTSNGVTGNNNIFGRLDYTRVATGYGINISLTKDSALHNTKLLQSSAIIATCNNVWLYNLDYTDRLVGSTTAAIGQFGVLMTANSTNCGVDGFTCGFNGLFPNQAPYAGLFNPTSCINVTFRNAGTFSSPISANATFAPTYILQDSGTNDGVFVRRCFLENTRTSTHLTLNSSNNIIMENLRGTTGAIQTLSNNSRASGIRATSNSVAGGSSVYGTHAFDMFYSNTTGAVWIALNEPTSKTANQIQTTFGPGAGFTSAGSVTLPNIGDSVTIDMGYFCKGHTGFAEYLSVFTAVGQANFTYEYQIDTGNGFSSWKRLCTAKARSAGGTVGTNTYTFATSDTPIPQVGDYAYTDLGTQLPAGTTVTNVTGNVVTFSNNFAVAVSTGVPIYFAKELIEETISPSDGFRLKIRVTTVTAGATNALTYMRFNTTSTLTAQQDNLYPLGATDVTFAFTNLKPGTEVVLFNSANVELDRTVISGTEYVYEYVWTLDDGDIEDAYALIWKDDMEPLKFTGITLSNINQVIPLAQIDDFVYSPTSSTISTFDAGNKLQILDTGVTTASVIQLYSEWKEWLRTGSNAQYEFAYNVLGGQPVSGSVEVPSFVFLDNDWKIRPHEAPHTLNVTDAILVAVGDPFVDTVGSYQIRINYQQPVQVLTVGGNSLTAQQVRDALTLSASETPQAGSIDESLTKIKNNTNLIPAAL